MDLNLASSVGTFKGTITKKYKMLTSIRVHLLIGAYTCLQHLSLPLLCPKAKGLSWPYMDNNKLLHSRYSVWMNKPSLYLLHFDLLDAGTFWTIISCPASLIFLNKGCQPSNEQQDHPLSKFRPILQKVAKTRTVNGQVKCIWVFAMN